jgi:hypothetical protein
MPLDGIVLYFAIVRNRTRWPGRNWASRSKESSVRTPTTGYPPVVGSSGPKRTVLSYLSLAGTVILFLIRLAL